MTQAQLERKVVLKNDTLHVRPISEFVNLVKKFPDTQLSVEVNGRCVDGKSAMDLLTLQARRGDVFLLKAHGLEAERLLNEMEALFGIHFNEKPDSTTRNGY
ncbi:MAG: HPr family phosphocarrier protein [Planctomycetes bacterium]|nr:HPr family phosphocarrier protein [Planctomycetota bacterium]